MSRHVIKVSSLAAFCMGLSVLSAPITASAEDEVPCPHPDGITFAIEPYEPINTLEPVFRAIGEQLSERLHCPVHVMITVSYSAEIEAMRSGHTDLGLFGPLGYVMAHKMAGVDAIAVLSTPTGQAGLYTASIVTRPSTGIHDLAGLRGRSFAYSDPASTSGHLLPAAALRNAGLDPDHDLAVRYAGTHTAAFEAIRNGQVDAAELNSETIADARAVGEYDPKDYVVLWQSEPIPQGPIAVAAGLSPAFRQKLLTALMSVDVSKIRLNDNGKDTVAASRLTPQTDAAYDGIRNLTPIIGVDTHRGP
ncbi:phosphate/phosphite/phosphonate ABC transporter substrate-binding protein [Gluconobacter cadivus]|uniref:phosphate/phosphite/phosphonate ABC transporter substrate-binding protein n=1 Tax=Gluconobacter cadivus TaxID=2728101 RepID=UPI001A9AD2F4|nr:phosphate/phosphite/phosphonate ABC transporter substrate-binding protein [Gluconobacter cadivus]